MKHAISMKSRRSADSLFTVALAEVSLVRFTVPSNGAVAHTGGKSN